MSLETTLNNVTLTYNGSAALKEISTRLSPGTIYGLLGRNGAGKTSLLSLLASFRLPTSGSIQMDEQDPFENPDIMPQVCFIYAADYSSETETPADYFDFTQRYRTDFDRACAEELAGRFRLPLDKPLSKLSRGMQSAFNAVLGLACRCPLTLFDEVDLGMDAHARELFCQEVLHQQERHPRTIVISTHLVSEMNYLFDHVLILHRGGLLADESTDSLLARGASVTGPEQTVDEFTRNHRILHTRRLGATRSDMVWGTLGDDGHRKAERLGLEIGPVSLQELFIHLTREENSQ